jgi:hypothetical protein
MQEELQQIIDCLDTSIPETIRILSAQSLESWMGTSPTTFDFCGFFFSVLELELRAYTLSYSTSLFVMGFFSR